MLDQFGKILSHKLKNNKKIIVHQEYNLDQELSFEAPKVEAPEPKTVAHQPQEPKPVKTTTAPWIDSNFTKPEVSQMKKV